MLDKSIAVISLPVSVVGVLTRNKRQLLCNGLAVSSLIEILNHFSILLINKLLTFDDKKAPNPIELTREGKYNLFR